MKTATFECSRSTNYQLHNKISQEDEYQCYLGRIRDIVDKRPELDESPRLYMQFLHKSKDKAIKHLSSEENTRIQLDNKHLLNKIVKNKQRKIDFTMESYHLAMHEKRHRQISRINKQNKKIARRINEQHSVVKKILSENQQMKPLKTEKRNITSQGWNCSPLKTRKLPKLGIFYPQEFKNIENS